MNEFKCTQGVVYAIKNAQVVSRKYKLNYVGTEEILYGLLCLPKCGSCKALNDHGVNKDNYFEILKETFRYNDATGGFTPKAKAVVNKDAEYLADVSKTKYISTEHILLAILNKRDCVAMSILRKMGVDFPSLTKELEDKIFRRDEKTESVGNGEEQNGEDDNDERGEKTDEAVSLKDDENNPLSKFGYDLTEKAKDGKLDPVIGREKEINQIIQSLSRRTKNSPVLIGEPGVGKSAVVEGLALEIASGTVPDVLRNKTIFSLNVSGLLAGAKYRGELEERFKNAIDYVVSKGDIILFIDEIHNIMGAGSTGDSSLDIAEMLKPMLARGELQTIGATTIDEYRTYIEKDPAVERRFQPIMIEAPSVENSIIILQGLKDKYEAHHNVEITDEAIKAAVTLSDRYITDRNLPDKAIDLIDEAAAKARLKYCFTPKEYSEKTAQLRKAENELDYVLSMGEDYADEKRQLLEKIDALRDEIYKINERALDARSNSTPKITGNDVAEVIAEWTKIPVTRITAGETDKLNNLENELHERVIGQDIAVNAVSRAIKRARTCIKDPNRPIGSFIFVGPTGVGKTELSKALADVVFGDKNSLIKIDMSEYMEKNAVSKLIGAPPGYVGYEDAGILTDKVRRKPYSVVLFDEIEKADSEIFNLMLQILDEGRLTDSKGKTVDFRNTIIILTSNVGAAIATQKPTFGFTSEADRERETKDRISEALKKKFSPEFLNRLDDIIVFHSLSREDCGKVVDVLLEKLIKRLADNGIKLKVAGSAADVIIARGYNEVYGARPLKRAITTLIEDTLTDALIDGRIKSGDDILVYAENGKIGFVKTR